MTRKNKVKKSALKFGGIFYKVAKTVAAPVAFIEQISEQHRAVLGSAFTNAPLGQKAKIMLNIVTGSASGFNFFKDEYQAPLSKFKIENIVNKWTKTGAALMGYAWLAAEVNKSTKRFSLPEGTKLGNIGRKLLVGGAIGGILDDPIGTASTSSNGTAQFSPQLNTQMVLAHGSTSGDSTESGL